MKQFTCDDCGQLVFFENSQCVTCGRQLAYRPELGVMQSFTWGQFEPETKDVETAEWHPCANYRDHNVCNWGVLDADHNPLCRSCRLTQVIPSLSQPENITAWFRLESAKRRLIYSLMDLGMQLESKAENPESGLSFEFLADTDEQTILTGHQSGLITVNLAEADDVERERLRTQLHEPYRTLLGHFRHESGHYVWDRWIRDSGRIEEFRQVFGDERRDYAAALAQHYEQGPAPEWQTQFISAYSASHPWEDWAETWAHYLHMRDGLEIAAWSGLRIRSMRISPPVTEAAAASITPPLEFDRMLTDWFSLTFIINNLNRGLGLVDAYPFVLSPPVVAKLRFIHSLVEDSVDNMPVKMSINEKPSASPMTATA